MRTFKSTAIIERPSKRGYNNLFDWLIGARNEGLLRQKDISVQQFADKIGVTRAAVYQYLSDANRPSPEVLKNICDVLEVPEAEGYKHVMPRVPGRPSN